MRHACIVHRIKHHLRVRKIRPLAAGLGFVALSVEFYRKRDDRTARRVFLGSITYLPVVLLAMTLDRGPVSIEAFFRGRGDATVQTIPEPLKATP